MLRRALLSAALALLALPASASAGQIMAGAAEQDASWHIGASAGQYASDGTFASVEGGDPHQHSTRRVPSYAIQSRLNARAIVVQGADGKKFAVVKNDLYIPQDLLWRRTAHILEGKGFGIGRHNLTMPVSHNHSSPMYSSTAWGVWAFQDVFDFRFFEYYAQAMATAVERAHKDMKPVKVGAAVTQYGTPQRNPIGPTTADDGSPAGFPRAYTDRDLIVVRFDALDGTGTIANLVNYAVHPEDLAGNDILSGDYIAPMQRMADRGTGGLTIYTQGAVGTTEPEDTQWTDPHERAYFSHRQYAQSEFKGRGIASQIVDTWKDIEKGTPEDPARFVPFRSDFANNDVVFMDRWFAGPASHPYPGVSSCRTDNALQGDPRAPVVGVPDCESAGGNVGFEPPLKSPGVSTDTIQQFGIPVPENYSAPSYTGLEENVSVHLQAFKIGDILFTVCSCEQWIEQSKNIKTRTDQVPGNQHNGFDWSQFCTQQGDGNWRCERPPQGDRPLTVSNTAYQKMKAQVNKDATGWDRLENVPFAESEPTDPNDPRFWGNFTHDDTPNDPDSAVSTSLGYPITAAIGMANDYNGYIASYREYQRGDHYRKALTAWGPHSSDYMATRLVKMGRHLRRFGDASRTDPYKDDPFPVNVPGDNPIHDEYPPLGGAKSGPDLAFNDERARVIGEFAANGLRQYEQSIPDDRAAAITSDGQPQDVERFGTAFFKWVGGSNFTDQPRVRVERFDDGKWTPYADQTGEVQVSLKFPPAQDVPAYRVQGSTFVYTAHFEAFVSRYDLMDRPQATPAGSYRFVVEGDRQEGGAPKRYKLTSREFLVKPWDGITINGFGGSTPGFTVGPRTEVPFQLRSGAQSKGTLGPIDYPDTYASPIKFIKRNRHFVRDRAEPDNPDKAEWYCIAVESDDDPTACSFRPWADVGDLARVVFTFVSSSGKVERLAGRKEGGRWVAPRSLRSGEGVYIESGDACDAFGNYNANPTAMAGNRNAVPDNPPAGFSCVPRQPREDIPPGSGGGDPPGKGGSGGGGGGGSGGSASASNPLGLPPKSKCIDRRKFRFKIHQPPRQRVVNVNVFINGKRRYSKSGRKVTTISIKALPNTGRYKVRIVALTNRGNRVISTRVYKQCKKSRPTTRVDRGGKKGR